MRIGQIFRYPSVPSMEVEIDGLPNWYAETKPPNDRGWSAVKLDSGINCSAILNGLQKEVPYIAISSSPHRFGSDTTPWEDIHRPDQGYCRYFGDNKPGGGAASESLGNRRMIEAFNLQGGDKQDREKAPPVLVFEAVPMDGRLKGQRIFHGFGLISRAELVVQRSPSSNKTFSNYVFDIALLNLEDEDDDFPWKWINSRRDPLVGSNESFALAPESWKNWVRKGKESVPTLRRNVITRNVVSADMNFSEWVKRTKPHFRSEPTIEYCQDLIAKAILFRSFAQCVKSQQYPALQSQILAISYSYFQFLLEKDGKEINLHQIWVLGSTQEELNNVILEVIEWVRKLLKTQSGELDPAQWAKRSVAWDKIKSIKSPSPPKVLAKLLRLDLIRDLTLNFEVTCAKACDAISKSTAGMSRQDFLSELNIKERDWDSIRKALLKDYDVVSKGTGKWTKYFMDVAN